MTKKEETNEPKKLYTRNEADEILAKGYPDDEELSHFPLGEELKTIPEVNKKYGVETDKAGKLKTPGHIRRVLEGMNILLSKTPEHIVKKWEKEANPLEQDLFTRCRKGIFIGQNDSSLKFCRLNDEDLKPFFRLCVMYHDIGKYIIHERHPSVGWHLIKDVFQEEVEQSLYPMLLNIPYDEWPKKKSSLTEYQKRLIHIFEMLVKYHDLFGVLSTGEASLPVMVDLIPLTGIKPQDAKELFSILMLFNLADLYGSVKEVYPFKVNYFCEDWKILCETIEKTEGNRNDFFHSLLEKEQKPDRTIKRITRLMNEGAPKEWGKQPINDNKIIEVFKSATLAGQHTFCKNFALFCKLDYALAFKLQIMDKAYELNCDITKPMDTILWLLVQLEKQYGDLCKRKDGSWRRLGVELAALTRKPPYGKDRKVSKIGETLCRLLLETQKGREWAVGECTVWFMEE
jgi:hypothetical protein